MLHPTKLSGHNACLWKLISEGMIDKALELSKVISFKLDKGIISSFTKEDEERFQDYNTFIEAIISKDDSLLAKIKTISPILLSILAAYIHIVSAKNG